MPEDPAVLPVAPVTKVAGVTTGGAYELPVYPFVEPAELRGKIGRHAVVVVGAGLAGLTAACDLALHGVPVVVLDEAGREIGRGIVRYDAGDAARICGLKTDAIEPALGYSEGPMIHADDLALSSHAPTA